MTFARPIKLDAGPTTGTYTLLAAICIFAGITLLFSAIEVWLKLTGVSTALLCFVAGWSQLNRQQGRQIIIYMSGAINIGYCGATAQPAEMGSGSFYSRFFVSLPLQLSGYRCRHFLISPGNNDKADYRRLLVWLRYGQQR